MRKGILVVAAILLVGFPAFCAPVRAAGNGTLQGQLVNGTSGGGAVAGIEVILHVLEGEQESSTQSATTAADGTFHFEGLDPANSWSYLVRATYKDVVYSAGPLQYEAGKNTLNAELRVYETTTDDQGIGVGKAHMFLEVAGAQLTVTELYVLLNSGDRTYIGNEQVQGHRWTSRFLLPAESEGLELYDGSLGGRFQSIEGGFVDTEPLWPGQTSVMFQYTIACPQSGCVLRRQLTYDLPSLNVLIPDTGITIESDRLAPAANLETQGGTFLNYVGSNLAAGQTVQLRLLAAGAARKTGPAPLNSGSLPWVLLGAVIAVGVVGYPFWRQRVRSAGSTDREA
jgi:hypothetical protein